MQRPRPGRRRSLRRRARAPPPATRQWPAPCRLARWGCAGVWAPGPAPPFARALSACVLRGGPGESPLPRAGGGGSGRGRRALARPPPGGRRVALCGGRWGRLRSGLRPADPLLFVCARAGRHGELFGGRGAERGGPTIPTALG